MKIPSPYLLRILGLIIIGGATFTTFSYFASNKEGLNNHFFNEKDIQQKGQVLTGNKSALKNGSISEKALEAQQHILSIERLNEEHAADFADILKSVNEPDIPISTRLESPSASAHSASILDSSDEPEQDPIAIDPEQDPIAIDPEEAEIAHKAPAERPFIFHIGSKSSLCQQSINQGIESYLLGLNEEASKHFEQAFMADSQSPSAACLLLIGHPHSIHAEAAHAMLSSLRRATDPLPFITPQEEMHLEALAYLLIGKRQAAAQKFEQIASKYRADKLAYLWAIVLLHDQYDSFGGASPAQKKALSLAAKAQVYWSNCPLTAYLSARLEESAPQISPAALQASRLAAEKMPEQGLSSLLLAQLLARSPLANETSEQRSAERLKLIQGAEKAFSRQQKEAMLPWTSSPNWIRARLQHINLLFLDKKNSEVSKLYRDTLKKLSIKDIPQQKKQNKQNKQNKLQDEEQSKSASTQTQRAHILHQDAKALLYWEVSSLPLRLALASLQASSPSQHARLLLQTPQASADYPDAKAIMDYKGCLRHALDARYHYAIDNEQRAQLSRKLAKELFHKLHISSQNSKDYNSRSQHARALEACRVAIYLIAIYHDRHKAQMHSKKANASSLTTASKSQSTISEQQRATVKEMMPPPSLLMPPSIPILWP